MKKILTLGLICSMTLVLSGCIGTTPTVNEMDKAALDAMESMEQLSGFGESASQIIDEIKKDTNGSITFTIVNPDKTYTFTTKDESFNIDEILNVLKYSYEREIAYTETAQIKTIKYTAIY